MFTSAAVTTALVGAASLAVFGMEPWSAFLDNLTGAAGRVSERLYPLQKIPSLCATLVLLNVDRALAIAVHGILVALVTVPVAWLWWKRGATSATMALLVAGTLLVWPYLYEYDLMVMAVAMGLVAWEGYRGGWLPWEREVLVLAWMTPFLVRVSGSNLGAQIGALCLIALYAVTLRRALGEGRNSH